MTPDRLRRLVLDRTAARRAPAVPELELLLADDMEHAWAGLQAELDDATLPPPFWAFAWLGGQAVARHVLDVPAEVAGRRVLDLATGSGLCALAAVRAGAAHVEGVDVDPVAVEAARLNAERNGLDARPDGARRPRRAARRRTSTSCSPATSSTTPRCRRGCSRGCSAAHRRGARVLLGDPGRHYLPRALLTEVASYDLATTRDLEGVLVKTTRVYAFGA